MIHRSRRIATMFSVLMLGACAVTINNAPLNQPLTARHAGQVSPPNDIVGENLVAFSFSGGGMRAAAFSFGVLKALEDASPPGDALLDELTFISSVSGGSLTAAYYGLHGKQMMKEFREKVLLQNMEGGMRLSALAPENFIRLLRGGLNDRSNIGDFLDKRVFAGATFADIYARRKPDIWINASDLYNRTPFPFIPPLFSAVCSDLASFSVAEAVSASMAVPLVFAPIVLKTYPDNCNGPLASWVETALANPGASKVMHASAHAVKSYRDPKRVRYVKLVDGGVTDNFGLSSIMIGRAVARTPYGPFTATDAVKLRRMLFLVVDAGRGPSGDWALGPDGPSGVDMALASTDTAIDSAARVGFDAFREMMRDWRNSIVDFRCSLPITDVARLRGSTTEWNCSDVQFELGVVSFADLGRDRESRLSAIPTRLTLPASMIDETVDAGFDAARNNPAFTRYLQRRIPKAAAGQAAAAP